MEKRKVAVNFILILPLILIFAEVYTFGISLLEVKNIYHIGARYERILNIITIAIALLLIVLLITWLVLVIKSKGRNFLLETKQAMIIFYILIAVATVVFVIGILGIIDTRLSFISTKISEAIKNFF